MTTFTDRLYALGTFSKRNKQTNTYINKPRHKSPILQNYFLCLMKEMLPTAKHLV